MWELRLPSCNLAEFAELVGDRAVPNLLHLGSIAHGGAPVTEIFTNNVEMGARRGQGHVASVWGPQETFLEVVNSEWRPQQELSWGRKHSPFCYSVNRAKRKRREGERERTMNQRLRQRLKPETWIPDASLCLTSHTLCIGQSCQLLPLK